jgi:hypothetical protein
MRISRAVYPTLLVVLLCVVTGVGTAVRAADAHTTRPAATTSKVAGTLSTHVVINGFKAVGKRVVGRGTAISRYTDAAGVTSTSRKQFWLRISERHMGQGQTPQHHTRGQQRSVAAAQQLPLCHVLLLEVGEVDLTLAGLHAILKAFNPDEPIQVRIQADREGGVLGRLFCDLAGGGGALPTVQAAKSAARTLTARTRGNTILRANATVYTPDRAASGGARTTQSARGKATPNAPRAMQEECSVLHLILGPVHLDVLGLIVDINKVLLDLKGIPGTLLGDIFCQLSNDPSPPAGGSTVAGTVSARMVINRFTAVGKRIVGRGTAVSVYTAKTGATTLQRKSFQLTIAKPSAAQRGSAARQQEALCQILFLEIGEVDLTLAGLHVTARAFNPEEPIRLKLQGRSEGGILGRLFCDLAQSGGTVTSTAKANLTAKALTTRMRGSTIMRVQTTIYTPYRAANNGRSTMGLMRGAAAPNAPQAAQVDECHVVHLILGPVHLDLLGLLADLNKIVVDVNAIPGTVLGDIFCLLRSDPPTTTTTTTTATTTTTTPTPAG